MFTFWFFEICLQLENKSYSSLWLWHKHKHASKIKWSKKNPLGMIPSRELGGNRDTHTTQTCSHLPNLNNSYIILQWWLLTSNNTPIAITMHLSVSEYELHFLCIYGWYKGQRKRDRVLSGQNLAQLPKATWYIAPPSLLLGWLGPSYLFLYSILQWPSLLVAMARSQ